MKVIKLTATCPTCKGTVQLEFSKKAVKSMLTLLKTSKSTELETSIERLIKQGVQYVAD